jgi:DNA repair protein RecN (Recombination protein N)
MLRSLNIRDFVIVDRLELEFQSGFTALTGETGAGKSILIDALSTVLGERAEAGLVRDGCERAEVAAEFGLGDCPEARALLAEADLAEDDVCLMRRVIDASGRSRAYINGRAVTIQQLRDIGAFLVDIHGQHEHQSLLRPASQRELLDGYAGASELAAAVAQARRDWQAARRSRLAGERDAAAIAREKEDLEWRVRDLETLGFRTDEWDALVEEHKRLANAASLIEAAQYSLQTLSEDDLSVLAAVSAVQSRLHAQIEFDARLREVLDLLDPAQIQLQETVYALRDYVQRLELDPQRMRDVESRLEAVHAASRKFRVTPPELPRVLEEARERLAELETGRDPATLAQREQAALEAYRSAATRLSAARAKAAKALSKKVTDAMQSLAMAGGRFEVALTPLEEGAAYGLEQVEFLVAAHAGTGARALAKVASGGELSRISLAVQTATSEIARVPTLVFDEVDAGIGGRVAEIVGRMLRSLGARHQVMCVTHLPQVAAAGDHQWQVSKRTGKNGVSSNVIALNDADRIEELARMLGGLTITETTRRHAAELLAARDNPARRR